MKKEILKEFVTSFAGSSFPTLCRTQSDRLVIIKMLGAGNGASSLMSEFIVNNAAHHLGWPVPRAFLIEIPSGFPWTFGTDEFDDLVQKSSGWNLGLEYIPDAMKIGNTEEISNELKAQVLALDYLFVNIDRTLESANLLQDKEKNLWIIDHGSCLIFQNMQALPPRIDSNHQFAMHFEHLKDLVLDRVRDLKKIDMYADLIENLPAQWCKQTNVTPESIRHLIRKITSK
ncbi:hypothetical protein P3G55_00885 [Leptospira sp. 96542]|nr:hypothetical protein [Leptospira sp. 96542]